MNKKQKTVLICVIVLMVSLFLCPPFQYEFRNYDGAIYSRQLLYSCILDPEIHTDKGWVGPIGSDTSLLITQMIGVLIITGAGWLLSKD